MPKTVLLVASRLSNRLGKCVRDLRLEVGMTQVEFAERCGFYQTYMSRIENGRANPTLNALEVISNALGLTVFDLFDRVKATRAARGAE
jgi:transcriptional regulator with XRE-family HTH domain